MIIKTNFHIGRFHYPFLRQESGGFLTRLFQGVFRPFPLFISSRGLFITLLVLSPGFLIQPARAGFATKSNNTTGFADASTFTREITFTAADFSNEIQVSDVNISIYFAKSNNNSFVPAASPLGSGNPYFDEISFIITSPGGTSVTLITNIGGASFNNGPNAGFRGTLTFDQSAATRVNANRNLITAGTYRPADPPNQSLDSFNGQNGVGIWTLQVGDDAAQDGLSFYGFSMSVSTIPEPGSVGLWGSLMIAVFMIAFYRPRRPAGLVTTGT